MAFYGHNRLMQMQEEMDRFEQEIAGQLVRPRMPGSNMSLRFIPHQLHARPVSYAPPPQPPSYPHGISTAAVAAAALAATAGNSGPRFHPIPAAGLRASQPASAVIEAAPTKYTTPTGGKGADARQASSSLISNIPSTIERDASSPAPAPAPHKPSESSRSKDQKSSNSALAYTVIGGSASTSKSQGGSQAPKRPKRYVRVGGGQVWTDPSLNEWNPNDFRLFCGDLGNEVSDELLAKAFRKYTSFQKAKVVREKRTNKTKGYGFVSFKDPDDFTRALREMDGKYVGNRPIKLRKSNWKDRNVEVVKKKVKVKQKLGLKL